VRGIGFVTPVRPEEKTKGSDIGGLEGSLRNLLTAEVAQGLTKESRETAGRFGKNKMDGKPDRRAGTALKADRPSGWGSTPLPSYPRKVFFR